MHGDREESGKAGSRIDGSEKQWRRVHQRQKEPVTPKLVYMGDHQRWPGKQRKWLRKQRKWLRKQRQWHGNQRQQPSKQRQWPGIQQRWLGIFF
jgi:hypothetical protein